MNKNVQVHRQRNKAGKEKCKIYSLIPYYTEFLISCNLESM